MKGLLKSLSLKYSDAFCPFSETTAAHWRTALESNSAEDFNLFMKRTTLLSCDQMLEQISQKSIETHVFRVFFLRRS